MMDAVEFFKNLDRMCDSLGDSCTGCEINKRMSDDATCGKWILNHYVEAIKIVERWAKEHPRKTRQSEFLKMFPRASMASNGTIDFCPNSFDEEFACPEKGKFDHSECECPDCRRKYWLEEVEE